MKKLNSFLIISSMFISTSYSQSFEWAIGYGNENDAAASKVVTDKNGNLYSIGIFEGEMDFSTDLGTDNILTPNSTYASYLCKYSTEGELLFAKKFDGVGNFRATAISTDEFENVYISGALFGTIDFDPGEEIVNLTAETFADAIVVKLSAAGDFIFAKKFGGSNFDIATNIDLDNENNIYLTGTFRNIADFDASDESYLLTSNGFEDIFLLKLNTDGEFVYCKQFGGLGNESCNGIDLDEYQNVYLTGGFAGDVDFDPTDGAFILSPTYDQASFILKLGADGDFIFAKKLESLSPDSPYINPFLIKIDNFGDIHLLGEYRDSIDLDPSEETAMLFDSEPFNLNPFIAKYDGDGNFIYAKQLDGTWQAAITDLTIDENHNAWLTGRFSGEVDFDMGVGEQIFENTNLALFVLKLDPVGEFSDVQLFGNESYNYGTSITNDPLNNIYISGGFSNVIDFNSGPEEFELTSNGEADNFIFKLGQYVLGNPSEQQNIQILAYPNPSLGSVNIELDNNYKDLTLIIQNNLGEEVYTENFSEVKNIVVDLPLAAGIYYISLKKGDHLLFGTKLIKQN
jgi:hypothetical protein